MTAPGFEAIVFGGRSASGRPSTAFFDPPASASSDRDVAEKELPPRKASRGKAAADTDVDAGVSAQGLIRQGPRLMPTEPMEPDGRLR